MCLGDILIQQRRYWPRDEVSAFWEKCPLSLLINQTDINSWKLNPIKILIPSFVSNFIILASEMVSNFTSNVQVNRPKYRTIPIQCRFWKEKKVFLLDFLHSLLLKMSSWNVWLRLTQDQALLGSYCMSWQTDRREERRERERGEGGDRGIRCSSGLRRRADQCTMGSKADTICMFS